MALDVLALGSYVFQDFAVPDALPGGGKQQIKLRKLPGGDRVADTMGPDDADRQFAFTIFSGDAASQVMLLDAMRIAGQSLPYSNGIEARIVLIESFTWSFEKFNVAHCNITLTPIDNPAGTSAASSPASSSSLVTSDISSASTSANTNVVAQSGGIGHA